MIFFVIRENGSIYKLLSMLCVNCLFPRKYNQLELRFYKNHLEKHSDRHCALQRSENSRKNLNYKYELNVVFGLVKSREIRVPALFVASLKYISYSCNARNNVVSDDNPTDSLWGAWTQVDRARVRGTDENARSKCVNARL